MGRVWRAADEMLDRPVAVKEMRIDGLDAEDTRTRRERTLREARATARIDHPNVVRVYDVVDEGERLWIVMELVGGRSLERLVAQDGPLSPAAAARIGLGLVGALRQVHARGVLHRDIKPGNVLVEDGAERIVLTDFGIAAIQDAKALTMVGMLVGSPDYMAPERISGRPQGPPSDVWSLGATLCAALGGRSPFSRDTTLATLHAVLYEEPKLPSAAGPLRDVLAALLEKDPSVRPDLDDLEEALLPVAFPPTMPTLPVGAGEGNGGAQEGEADESAEPAAEAETRPRPVVEPERPTPVYLDTRLVRAARDPRQPEPEAAQKPALDPAPVEDAVPRELPEPATPSAHQHVNASSEVPSEVRSEVRSEIRSEAPSAASAPPATASPASAPPATGRPGVNLVRTPTVPEQHTPRGNGSGAAAPGARQGAAPTPELSTRPALGPHPLRTPQPDLPGPAVPAGPRPGRGRRRAGFVAAGGLAAAGAVVAAVLLANSGSPGGNQADSSSSSATTADSSAPPTVEGTSRPQTLPPGVHREGGYAWATPKGWRRDVKTGSEVHYTSPDGTQELAAASSVARGDLMETWRKSEQNAHQGQNYQKIRLEKTTFRGNPAVVWEYTFTLNGTPWHARLLGFTQEGKTFQINTWYQPGVESQALKTYTKTKNSFIVL
ncbi:serine/threonine-protein kinase [Streptomyces sp. NPDC057616]|uniref:serine/threonine-protein kinase n=1 Tax=Streptomyces sp. NPDC057616 TaxID=3346183 RepID=UPI0036A4EC65